MSENLLIFFFLMINLFHHGLALSLYMLYLHIPSFKHSELTFIYIAPPIGNVATYYIMSSHNYKEMGFSPSLKRSF